VFDGIFSHLDTIHERDRQTDGLDSEAAAIAAIAEKHFRLAAAAEKKFG